MKKVEGKGYALYQGDSTQIIRNLNLPQQHVAIVADPPYGDNHDTDYTRFSGGANATRHRYEKIANDAEPFDPSLWLNYPNVVLFGANRFSDCLPTGTWLVWDKRTPGGNKNVMSDAEVAWWNRNRGVYIFEHAWDGFNRASERNTAYHPTQKPVALFSWVLEKLNLPTNTIIVDPYMGSGPVGIVAIKAGYQYVGVELNCAYFDIAHRRIEDASRAVAGLPKRLTGQPKDYTDTPLFAMEAT